MRSRLPLALFLLVAQSACAGRATNPMDMEQQAAERPIRIQVNNNNFNDITVYAIAGGAQRRLGAVTGNSSQTYELPRSLNLAANRLQIRASPLGARGSYTSAELAVFPGDLVVVDLAAELTLSNISIRRNAS